MNELNRWIALVQRKLMLFAGMKNITITLKIYLLLTSAFTFFRIILFIANRDKIPDTIGSINWLNVALAFFMGLRFDIVVAGYLLLLPFFILTIISVSNYNSKLVLKLLYYFMILISINQLVMMCIYTIWVLIQMTPGAITE